MKWVEQAKARGLGPFLSAALDILEPLGPLSAQVLWITQPVMGLFGGRDFIQDLAQALESPGGVEELRRQLEDKG